MLYVCHFLLKSRVSFLKNFLVKIEAAKKIILTKWCWFLEHRDRKSNGKWHHRRKWGKKVNFPWWKKRTEGDIKELKNDIKTDQEFRWWIWNQMARSRNGNRRTKHCLKSVQIRSFLWCKYRKIRTRKNSVFWHISRSESKYC